jgi:hypothetical protein
LPTPLPLVGESLPKNLGAKHRTIPL